jgi:hypothetical protein
MCRDAGLSISHGVLARRLLRGGGVAQGHLPVGDGEIVVAITVDDAAGDKIEADFAPGYRCLRKPERCIRSLSLDSEKVAQNLTTRDRKVGSGKRLLGGAAHGAPAIRSPGRCPLRIRGGHRL